MIYRFFTALLVFFVISVGAAFAQSEARNNLPGKTEQEPPAARTSADETFDLNISERRINKSDLAASTAVEIGKGGSDDLNLRVGVAVTARNIDVLLRGVTGRVRFHATLEPVLRRIRSRRATPVAPK